MNLTRFPSLGLRDPGFLRTSGPPPPPITTADANTQAWWKADSYVVENSVVGDKMDATANKTSLSAPNFNLVRRAFPYAMTGDGTTSNLENYARDSEVNTTAEWSVTSATRTATTVTFTGTGGNLRQNLYYCDEVGASYKLEFEARLVSGNANLQILTTNSPSGNKTPVTLTGVTTKYSVTFSSLPAGTAIVIGIQDDNAAGFGTIEISKWHVYRVGNGSSTYISTVTTGKVRTRGGLPIFTTGGGIGASDSTLKPPVNRSNAGVQTIYMSIFLRSYREGEIMMNGGANFTHKMAVETVAPYRFYTYQFIAPLTGRQYSTRTLNLGQWYILTSTWDAANSGMRVNLLAEEAANHPTSVDLNSPCFGGDYSSAGTLNCGLDIHEIILRYTKDDTATQNLFIKYLAGQVGLSV